jgi:hypothetical protein
MKKSIFIAVLGLAAGVASSYGQGYVIFSSYAANGGAGALTSFWQGGAALPVGYTAQLYYALGTVSDPVNQSSQASITSPITGLTLLAGSSTAYDNSGGAVGAPGLGYFDNGVLMIPNYVSGPITFEILATGPNDIGRSGAFTDSGIATSASAPAPTIGDTTLGGFPSFVVAPVPEPTTLVLAGLGGLASLVMLRRKTA